MKIPKMKIKVKIICRDNSFITGFMHVDEGYRLLDFINENKKNFLAITEAKLQNTSELHSFKLHAEFFKKRKSVVLLNKDAIRWIEEEE